MKSLSLCVLVLLAAALAVTAQPGRACSCVPPDPWSYLERADGAFVGELVRRRQIDEGRVVLTFDVERAVKGRIGDTVEVQTASSGASCGIEAPVGTRIGLFLAREGGRWIGNLCWQVAPEDLLAAASLPAPNGRGRVALYVGGRFGPARMLALDAKGRMLAYGIGDGGTGLLSMCPGSQRLAEVAAIRSDKRQRTTYEIAIRDASLRVIRRQAVRLPGWRFASGLLCEDRLGSSVVIFANWAGDSAHNAAIYRLSDSNLRTVWKGTAFLSSLRSGIAYLNAGFSADRFVSVDLQSGRVRHIARLPRSPRLEPNRTGTKFAGVAYRLTEKSRLFLVDVTTRPPGIRSAPLAAPEVFGDVFWVSERRLLFIPSDRRDQARVLDLELRALSRFRWTAGQGALAGKSVFGIEGRSLVAAKLPSGPTRVIRRLPGKASLIVSAAPS